MRGPPENVIENHPFFAQHNDRRKWVKMKGKSIFHGVFMHSNKSALRLLNQKL